MEKRLEFQCWNCTKTYTLLRTVEEGSPQLSVACPYCKQAAVVDLNPFRTAVETVYRGDDNDNPTTEPSINPTVFDLPNTLPTHPEADITEEDQK